MIAYETPSIELLGDESLQGVQGEAGVWSKSWAIVIVVGAIPAVAPIKIRAAYLAVVAGAFVAYAWAIVWRE